MVTIGQKLWFVPDRRGDAKEVEVTKVGRKWATLNTGCPAFRIDIQTLVVDGRGWSSPGRCYVDREAYELNQRRRSEWHHISNRMSRMSVPATVTLEDILAAAKLLGIE